MTEENLKEDITRYYRWDPVVGAGGGTGDVLLILYSVFEIG